MNQAKFDVVEMKAAALNSFAKSKNKKVICFAHITNYMTQRERDFERTGKR